MVRRKLPERSPSDILLRDLVYEAVRARVSIGTITTLIELAKGADEEGVTLASVRGIARDLDLSSGTVSRHVAQLVELGFLVRLGGYHSDNRRWQWSVPGMDMRSELRGVS